MPPEVMYHMFGEGQHQRLQEGGFRDHRQLYNGALGGYASASEIQGLEHHGEDRQDVRLHGKYFEGGAQSSEQIGGGPPVPEGRRQIHALAG
eukprot:1588810-Heterocapsa_arctica.AAC.1